MSDDVMLNETTAEEARAEVAFKRYLLMAPKRSVDALLSQFQEEARQFGRGSVPTTNRTTIYKWAKQYKWTERAAEHDKRIVQADTKSYDMLRSLRFDNLFELSESAVSALRQLIEEPKTRADVRLKAAQTVLDRIGVTEDLIQRSGSSSEPANIPDPEASNEELNRWLAEQRR